MINTIESLCAEVHNYFETSKEINDYTIENGIISLPFLVPGQFFRIVGSKFNDGVYIYGDGFLIREATWEDIREDNPNWNALTENTWGNLKHYELIDEEFHGAVWPMAVPRAFIALGKEVSEYLASDAAKESPYISESLGGNYSYTKGKVTDNAWNNVFSSKLRRWRKAVNV